VDLDLNEIVGNMTKMLQRLIGERISLESHYAAGGAPVHADPGMMEQILMNLAVNSRDAMPKGGSLILRTEIMQLGMEAVARNPKVRSGRFVQLSVSDTGTGIPLENMPRIFEPFFTTKEIGKGTGLGLATVFGIVQQHHGWIDVESQPGAGTIFRIYLPCQTHQAAKNVVKTVSDSMPSGGETILIVEDEESVRDLVRHVLALKGYTIFEAPNAAVALEIWRMHQSRIDLLLTDLVIPGDCSGSELATRLLAEKPELKVIYCSGYSDEVLGGDVTLRHRANFLQKPYNLSKLTQMVRDCLDG
jgi:CheY-like chemotaxis protein